MIDWGVAGERSDLEIETEVKERLDADIWIDSAFIDVEATDGTVFLTGTVGSAAEKRRARMAGRVAGVEAVDATGLDVEYWPKDRMQQDRKVTTWADDQIRDAVASALTRDPRVASFDIDIRVEDGVATLRGEVDTWYDKHVATENAFDGGARDVRNLLTVRTNRQLEETGYYAPGATWDVTFAPDYDARAY